MQKFKEKKYYLLMCIICIMPRLILATQALPFRTRADELGTLAGAAYLAGFNWSDLLNQTAYYGFGATIFFAPLFYVFSNPLLLYKIMIGSWGILQGIVGCIAWKLGKDYFNVENKRVLMLLSVIASYSVVTRNTAIFNETPLIIVMWLLCWCLLSLRKNIQNNKKKNLLSGIVALLLVYSLTLHTRAIIFWIAIVFIGVAYFWVTRKFLFSIRVCCVVMGGGYFVAKWVILFLQNAVWASKTGEGLANTKIAVSGIKLLTQPDSWQAWLNIILGQLNTFSMISGAVIIVALVWTIKSGVEAITKRNNCKDAISFLCIMGFASVCMLGTIFGQSISEWLGYATEAMKEGIDNQAYGLKGFTYIRYAGPYIGILIWAIMLKLIKNKEEIIKLRGVSITATLLVHVYWLVCILPYIFHNQVTNEAFLPFGFINNIDGFTRLRVYLAGTVVILLSVSIFWLLIKLDKKVLLLVFYSCFLIYQFCYDGYYQDVLLMKKSYNEVKPTYEAIKKIDESKEISFEKIGVCDVKNTSHSIAYVYQFCFYDKEIIATNKVEEALGQNDIIVINDLLKLKEFVNQGYYVIIVDENTDGYVATKNENIKDALIKEGYLVLN